MNASQDVATKCSCDAYDTLWQSYHTSLTLLLSNPRLNELFVNLMSPYIWFALRGRIHVCRIERRTEAIGIQLMRTSLHSSRSEIQAHEPTDLKNPNISGGGVYILAYL
jgi:hypothetical protein